MNKSVNERPKMSRAKRAKQFMPFRAVVGLEEALRIKEEELESKEGNEKFPDDAPYDYDEEYDL